MPGRTSRYGARQKTSSRKKLSVSRPREKTARVIREPSGMEIENRELRRDLAAWEKLLKNPAFRKELSDIRQGKRKTLSPLEREMYFEKLSRASRAERYRAEQGKKK